MGVEARCRPCHSAAHFWHMKRQPFLCNGCPCRGYHHCNRSRHLCCHCQLCCRHRCCCHCNCPLPLPLPSAIAVVIAISVALPSAIAVTVALAVGHCRLRHCQPLQLPSLSAITVAMPSAISESCCLGAVRIVFHQLKQIMLTLFYFVWTVGGALIKAG